MAGDPVLHALDVLHHELTLFAGFWLILGLLDDLLVDALWLWLVLVGRAQSGRLPEGFSGRALSGPMAVFIPAWREAAVIGVTIRHALAAWPQPALRIYLGCYGNDPATAAAARQAAAGDPRLRLVVVAPGGPTTKAHCLNRLYAALVEDELRDGEAVRAVVLHDAEDMVHPAEPALFDLALRTADFVQLPVRAEPLAGSPWVAGHYIDEFAEAHGKTQVVRDALGAALPAAGVGCALVRPLLTALAGQRGGPHGDDAGPFAPESLTEDYEIGWRIARGGGRSRFLRCRDHAGTLVATRAVFPDTFDGAVRQKSRWTHGIACQSWDRLGWGGTMVDRWMALRDRRAPLAAIVLVAAYSSLGCGLVLAACSGAGLVTILPAPGWERAFGLACGAGLVWRLALRLLFSGREYGVREGLRAMVRVPVANIIAIASAYRAVRSYLRVLRGEPITWDKTAHSHHPAASPATRQGPA